MSTLPEGGKWPPAVIFEAWEALDHFCAVYHRATGHHISAPDLQEIVTQVLMTFLNENLDDLEHLTHLPEFNRMQRADFTPDAMLAIEQATMVFGMALVQKIRGLGLESQGEFPYAFNRFIGRDILLMHIPY